MKTGKIYKIIHTQSDICYVGSTFNTLRDRWRRHKNNFENYLFKEGDNVAIFKYFKEFGVENFKIILIKEYMVIDRIHLEMYEQLWINKLNSVNINNPFNIMYEVYKKQYRQVKYQENKDYYKNKNKEYREKNDELIKMRKRGYYQANKDKILKKEKEYREKNIEKQKQKDKKYYNSVKYKRIMCECGTEIQYVGRFRHQQTKKHFTLLNFIH